MNKKQTKKIQNKYPKVDLTKVNPRILSMAEDMEDIVQTSKGKAVAGVKVTTLPRVTRMEFKRVRHDIFHCSQSELSRVLNVSTETIKAWEQGKSPVTGLAGTVVRLVEEMPGVAEVLRRKAGV